MPKSRNKKNHKQRTRARSERLKAKRKAYNLEMSKFLEEIKQRTMEKLEENKAKNEEE